MSKHSPGAHKADENIHPLYPKIRDSDQGSTRIQVWTVKTASSRPVNVAQDLKINHVHLFLVLFKTQESSNPFPS
jgi:hypothetical protein